MYKNDRGVILKFVPMRFMDAHCFIMCQLWNHLTSLSNCQTANEELASCFDDNGSGADFPL